jgi:hypothetical protein
VTSAEIPRRNSNFRIFTARKQQEILAEGKELKKEWSLEIAEWRKSSTMSLNDLEVNVTADREGLSAVRGFCRGSYRS